MLCGACSLPEHTDTLTGQVDKQHEKEYEQFRAKEVPTVIVDIHGDEEDQRNTDINQTDHEGSLQSRRSRRVISRKAWTERDAAFRGIASALLTILAGLLVAHTAASLTTSVRTVSSTILGCIGGLLTVQQFREKLAPSFVYYLVGLLAFVVGCTSYTFLGGLHPWACRWLMATLIGSLPLVACYLIGEPTPDTGRTVKNIAGDTVTLLGCNLIAVGAIVAINPL